VAIREIEFVVQAFQLNSRWPDRELQQRELLRVPETNFWSLELLPPQVINELRAALTYSCAIWSTRLQGMETRQSQLLPDTDLARARWRILWVITAGLLCQQQLTKHRAQVANALQ